MSDDLTARRNQRTMAGVIACGPKPLAQEDIDAIASFKAYLVATAHLPRPGQPITREQVAERRRLYNELCPDEPAREADR